MQKAKSRLKKHNRLEPAVWLTGSVVLGIYLTGYGQISEMITTWNSLPVVEARTYKNIDTPIKIEPTESPKIVTSEYVPSNRALKLIEKHPGLASKIRDTFGDQWRYAAELIARESSFNKKAINPSSGACGLSQALPCSKMKCDLEDEQCQLNWIKTYVTNRYGDVKKAVEFHNSNNWY